MRIGIMKTSGFTLLEILIVLGIILILAAVSHSSWQASVLKVHRTEATSLLMNIAMLQEQHFYTHNHYTNDLTSGLGLNIVASTSENGYFKILVTHQTQQEHGIDSFTVTAIAIANQTKDDECQRFTINQLSQRLAYDQENNKNDACWE